MNTSLAFNNSAELLGNLRVRCYLPPKHNSDKNRSAWCILFGCLRSYNFMTEQSLIKKPLHELTHTEMYELVDALPRKKSMRDEMHIGVDFLKLLLARHGKDAVISCVERLHQKLKDGSPHENYDFLDKTDGSIDELALLNQPSRRSLNLARPKVRMSRRDFFETVGWTTLATFWGTSGALKVGDSVTRSVRQDPSPIWMEEADETMHKYGDGPADLLLGGTVLHYATGYWQKMKLEHVANAIDEMAKKLKPNQQISER